MPADTSGWSVDTFHRKEIIMKAFRTILASALAAMLLVSAAVATPVWLKTFDGLYKPKAGTELANAKCMTCHEKASGGARNATASCSTVRRQMTLIEGNREDRYLQERLHQHRENQGWPAAATPRRIRRSNSRLGLDSKRGRRVRRPHFRILNSKF